MSILAIALEVIVMRSSAKSGRKTIGILNTLCDTSRLFLRVTADTTIVVAAAVCLAVVAVEVYPNRIGVAGWGFDVGGHIWAFADQVEVIALGRGVRGGVSMRYGGGFESGCCAGLSNCTRSSDHSQASGWVC